MAKKSAPQGVVTVFDVADHAGVSIATVSRALSGNRRVSESSRRKVLRSAEELGYQVNLVGRALRQKKTSTLGLVIPDLENPFFSGLAQQLSRSFSESEIDLLVASSDNTIEQEKRAVQSFLGRQVDALVMIPSDEVASAESVELAHSYVPTIQFDRRVPQLSTPFVGCDNDAGMKLIDEHLATSVELDRQPLYFVGGGSSSSSGRERSDSFHRLRPDARFLEGRFSFEWGQEAAQRILEAGATSGTIITAADVVALGAISWLISSGFRIPHDFRVVGFDDVGVSYLAHPTLTTVRQPVTEMTEAIRALLTGEKEFVTTNQRFAPTLQVRDSSPEHETSRNLGIETR